MIIVDFHQVMISNILAHLASKTINKNEIEEGLVRHMVLNSIRTIHNKFKYSYGKMVIAYDSKDSWRKKAFPYYKLNRKKAQDKSFVDWNELFNYMNKIKPELKEVLPYQVIEIEGCEADDIIGTLVRYWNTLEPEPVMIVSGDRDFIQLHYSRFIKQYDPVHKKKVEGDVPPQEYLITHILKGDAGDGIPNVLSDDDTFVAGKRQKPLTKKKLEHYSKAFKGGCVFVGSEAQTVFKNYKRNEEIIDLTKIPQDFVIKIMEEYANKHPQDRSKLHHYLMEKNCNFLLENVNDF